MRFYINFLQKVFVSMLFYTVEAITNSIIEIFWSLISLTVSFAVNQVVHLFSFEQLFLYIMLSSSLLKISTHRSVYEFSDMIESGNVIVYFTKPINPLVYVYLLNCFEHFPKLILNLVVFNMFGILLGINFVLLLKTSLLIFALLPVYLAYNFAIEVIFMSITFYLERVSILRMMLFHTTRLLGGGFVPVDFISKNTRYTFIYYSIGVYPDIILGRFNPLLILVWVGWIMVLGSIAVIFYKKAIKHISINRG